jgi:hypothetical protein
LWFRSTHYGDDKDRVVIRSNGRPTYLAADVGYLIEKFGRGFDQLIYIWGADHHGTVARLRGAAQALGFGREQVQVMLIQGGGPIPQYVKTGKLVALGISSLAPSKFYPGLPTIAETFPGFETESWVAMLAPAATPKPVIAPWWRRTSVLTTPLSGWPPVAAPRSCSERSARRGPAER